MQHRHASTLVVDRGDVFFRVVQLGVASGGIAHFSVASGGIAHFSVASGGLVHLSDGSGEVVDRDAPRVDEPGLQCRQRVPTRGPLRDKSARGLG